jgi:hypothetical protein
MSIPVANHDMKSETIEVPRSLSLVMLTLEKSLSLVLLLTSVREISCKWFFLPDGKEPKG